MNIYYFYGIVLASGIFATNYSYGGVEPLEDYLNTLDWVTRDVALLPDESSQGCGYGGKLYTEAELNEIRRYITETMNNGEELEGYENRGLINKNPAYSSKEDGFILPPGFDADSPIRSGVDWLHLEPNNPTSLDCVWHVPAYLEGYYRKTNHLVDQHGRWVHPLAAQVIDADIPICTGYGVGWEGGETIVVNAVVQDDTHMLFMHVNDSDRDHSLVSDYTHPEDFTTIEKWRVGERLITLGGINNAVRRIVKEKAGFNLPQDQDAQFDIVWGARPWGPAQTANFGILIYTVCVLLPRGMSKFLETKGNAFWQPKWTTAHVVNSLWPDQRRGFDASTA